MAVKVSPNLSVIVSIWMETLFYGMNVVVYLLALYTLLVVRKHAARSTKYFLVVTSTILFLTTSAHMGVNVARLIQGYVNPPDKLSMTKFLLNITEPSNVTKSYLIAFSNFFADVLIAWRVYMVWERNILITTLPTLLCLVSFAASITTATYVDRSLPGQSIFAMKIAKWGKAQVALNLAMNVSATTLIAGRIWWATRPLREHRQKRLTKQYWLVICIIVESAALAACMQTVELAFYLSNFPGLYFVGDTTLQIMALNPLMIIAFVGQSNRQDDAHVWTATYASFDANPCRPSQQFRHQLTEPCYVINEDTSEERTSLCMSTSRCTELSDMKFSENEKTAKGKKPKGDEDTTRTSMTTIRSKSFDGLGMAV